MFYLFIVVCGHFLNFSWEVFEISCHGPDYCKEHFLIIGGLLKQFDNTDSIISVSRSVVPFTFYFSGIDVYFSVGHAHILPKVSRNFSFLSALAGRGNTSCLIHGMTAPVLDHAVELVVVYLCSFSGWCVSQSRQWQLYIHHAFPTCLLRPFSSPAGVPRSPRLFHLLCQMTSDPFRVGMDM